MRIPVGKQNVMSLGSYLKRGVKGYGEYLYPKNSPHFMILGAQKCGTTSLHDYLDAHPALSGSYPKETHYFDRDFYTGKKFDDYQKCFRGKSSLLHYEATPSYLYTRSVPELLSHNLSDLRFIVLLRNPVQRAYSAWNHYRAIFDDKNRHEAMKNRLRLEGNLLYEKFYSGRSVFPSFRECVDIELELIEANADVFEPSLLRRGLYLEQLQNYWKYFDKNRFMIIGFQALSNDTENTLAKIEAFLDIPSYQWRDVAKRSRTGGITQSSFPMKIKFF